MGAVCSVSSLHFDVTSPVGRIWKVNKQKRQKKTGILLKMASSLSTGTFRRDNAEQQYIYIWILSSLTVSYTIKNKILNTQEKKSMKTLLLSFLY